MRLGHDSSARSLTSIGRIGLGLAIAGVLSGPARAQITHVQATLDGAQECTVVTPATGAGNYTLDTSLNTLKYRVAFQNLSSPQQAAHIHGPAVLCAGGGVVFGLPNGPFITGSLNTTPAQNVDILNALFYTNIHSNNFSGGEIRGQMTLSPALGTALCFGNSASPTPCPCGNFGGATRGCENSSTTTGARLDASGQVSPDNVVLICQGMTPSSTAVFVQGDLLLGIPAILGDGLRCVAGNLKRIGIKNSSPTGWVAYPEAADLPITVSSAALGDVIAAGTTRWYQAWYRDTVSGFCPAVDANVSSAVAITW